MRTKIKDLKKTGEHALLGKEATIKGRLRTVRNQKTFAFIEVNDGSTLSNFQIIMYPAVKGYDE